MPRISIQITAHNHEKFIGESIESAISCRVSEDDEIIVFDDASTDDSLKIIKEKASGNPFIKVMGSVENVGAAASRSEMVKSTSAKYIAALDGDDIFIPGWLEKQADFMDRRPEFSGTYGKVRLVDEKLNDLGITMGGTFSRFIIPYFNPICHGGSMLRRSAILDSGNYMETGQGKKSVGVDLFLWYRVVLKHDLFFENRFRYLYRNITSKYLSGKFISSN